MINNHRDRAQSHARPQGHWTSRVTSIGSLLVSYIQGESKKPDTFDIQMNNKGVSFF